MKKYFNKTKLKNLYFPILVVLLFSLTGCHVPLLYLMKGMEYEKDISNQERSQEWIGKSFALKEDMYLYTYFDLPGQLFLSPLGYIKPDINEEKFCDVIDIVSKGTIITISNIEQTYRLGEPCGFCNFFVEFVDSKGFKKTARIEHLLWEDIETRKFKNDDRKCKFEPRPEIPSITKDLLKGV